MIELIIFVSLIIHKMADLEIAMGLLCVNALIVFFEEWRAEKMLLMIK